MSEIIVHQCPPACTADREHAFDAWTTFWRCANCGHEYATGEVEEVATICPVCFVRACHESGGSAVCACGLTAMDYDMVRLP